MAPLPPKNGLEWAFLFGDPVQHSLSPRMHNMAFAACGRQAVYLAVKVEPHDLEPLLKALPRAQCLGFNLTVPLKEKILPLLDDVDATAKAIGAVNTVVFRGSQAVGYNTDAQGFSDALEHSRAFKPAQKKCIVLGAGGAARACVYQLAKLGAAAIVIANRNARRAEGLAADLQTLFPAVALNTCTFDAASIGNEMARADLLLNATSLRSDGVRLPLPEVLPKDLLLYDLAYDRGRAALVQWAKDHSWKMSQEPLDGLDMLVRQAAASFALWTDLPPPLEIMKKALTDIAP